MTALAEFGHYRYRGRSFIDKFDAYDMALSSGDLAPAIEFVFPVPDTDEPPDELTELYRQRAQQLRDSYDHLILMYSGGSDSTQVLTTFLRHNIRLDEIISIYPLGFCERLPLSQPSRDDPLGLLYEYRHAACLGLDQVCRESPRTTIRVIDPTDAFAGDMVGWQDCFHGPRISGGTHGLYFAVKRTREAAELQRRADALRGKRIAVIYACDKPFMRLIGNELFLFFSDTARMGIEQHWQHRSQILYDPIMFFWGDRRIPVKQAHLVRRVLSANPDAVADIRRRGVNVYLTNGIPHLDLTLIYPEWDWRYQQSRKRNDGAILPAFLGDRAHGVALERDRYYRGRYGLLRGLQFGKSHLSDLKTLLYRIGTVDARLDGDFSTDGIDRASGSAASVCDSDRVGRDL